MQQQEDEVATLPPVKKIRVVRVKSDSDQDLSFYSLNVFFTTILFLVIFITGTSWTMAVNKQFEKKPDVARYWVYALAMTLLTVGLAIFFGEMGRLLKQRINVNISTMLGSDLE